MGPEEIKALQQQLAARGLYRGKIDGIMGNDTLDAAKIMRQQDDQRAAAEAVQRQQDQQFQIQQQQLKLQQEQQATQRAETDRKGAEEAYQRSPTGQAVEAGKLIAPLGAGMALGHRQAQGIEARQSAMDPMRQASMGTGRRFAPYGARAMTYFIPEGLALREWVAPQLENKTARDVTKGLGTGLLAAGMGTIGEGAVKSLTPPKVPGAPMGWGLPPQQPQQSLPAPPVASPPPAAPPVEAEPAAPTTQRHSERLVNAARAAGASGRLTKEEAADFLTKNLSDANRMAVAEALGVKSGPNFAKRIATAMKNMTSTRGVSSIALPLAAGAYAASTTDAEAGTGEPASWGDSLVTGGAAAGGVAAGQYAMSKLPQSIGRAFGAGAPAFAPGTVDAMTDYSPDELAMGRNMLARNLPSFLRGGAVEDAYQMAQVPERNPMRQQGLPYGAMGFGMPPR
jgi:hypothetical protein